MQALRARSRLALLAGYAVATFLSFPHPIAGRVVDLGVGLAWLSPALLLLGLRGLPPGAAARWGFGAGLLAHTAILHWIWIVTVRYGHADPLLGLLGPVGLGAYIAAFVAAFAGLVRALSGARRQLPNPFLAAALWVALDHLRSFALSGFPWATLGYAQHLNPALLGLAPVTGVYGLSFLTVLGGAAGARVWLERRAAPVVIAAFAVLAVAGVAGLALHAAAASDPGDSVRVAVVQGNIEQGVKWSDDWYEHTLARYERLSRAAAREGAELIVWPETAVPGFIESDYARTERFAALARETRAAYVLGAVGLERGGGGRPHRVFDSAFAITANGVFLDRYDKTHLVPFGEYVPFQEWVGRFFQAVARGIAATAVTPGGSPRALPLVLPDGAPLRAGVPICYELLFPDAVRRFVGDGAEMLLAITNDAWYGQTGAPYQFLAITALRSAENRVWTARAANTGVSAIIDAGGRVRAQTRIFETDYLVADLPRRPAPAGGSFYTRHGDVFALACWLGAAGFGLAAWLRNRRETRT